MEPSNQKISRSADRDSIFPLGVGAGVAVLLHLTVIPMWTVGFGLEVQHSLTRTPEIDRTLPVPDELELGLDDSAVSTVAWIAYDDYRKLMAAHSVTEQPALQQKEDSVPDAPMELDPTPPAPTTAQPSRPASTQKLPSLETAAARSEPLWVKAPQRVGNIPFAKRQAPSAPGQPIEQAHGEQDPSRAASATPSPARPTAAPRSAREAPPVTVMEGTAEVRPGRVLTGKGLEIRTVRPQFSIVARLSTVPRNPEALITFDRTGRVVEVELTQAAGSKNIDGPVIAAFYKWKARGEKIEKMEGQLKIRFRMILAE